VIRIAVIALLVSLALSQAAAGSSAADERARVAPANELTLTGIGTIHFGQSKARVISTLTARFGAPSGKGFNTACGKRYSEVVWDALAVEFRRGIFSGYRYVLGGYPLTTPGSPPPGPKATTRPPLRTARGITLGSPIAAVRSAYPNLRVVGVQKWMEPQGFTFLGRASSASQSQNAVTEIKLGTCGDF
jgi:hypothetical protein